MAQNEVMSKLNNMIEEKPSIELKKDLIILFYFDYEIQKNDSLICSKFLGVASKLLENGYMLSIEFLKMHDEIVKVLGEVNIVCGNTPENIINAAIECDRNDILEKCIFYSYSPISLKGFYMKMLKKQIINRNIIRRLHDIIF